MSKSLVIVESPAKAKTIKKYLGKGYEVLASYGHVRDLVPKEGAVDPDNNFAMKYQVIEKNEKHIQKIANALKNADRLLLATDPDREGEAISWHLRELLNERGILDGKEVQRVVFYEITKRAIKEAVDHPRSLSDDLISAQQARRALDYLVGFNLSPLLWKKIRRGLSAGRVQSPALRMIVEREEEIERFIPREYWTIEANLEKDSQAFSSRLFLFAGKKVEQFSFEHEESATQVETTLHAAAKDELTVTKVDKKQRRRNPTAPFTTSTLQQEASRKLGFGAQRTMRTAQQLYEGMDIGHGTVVGLITYMRTDSVTLANEALQEIRDVIENRYGKENLPEHPLTYKTKAKNAQEAHEAIRPTSAAIIPEEIKDHLTPDQWKLYDLIWKRTVACQMTSAIYDTVALDIQCGEGNVFRANGSVMEKPGFIAVYQEGVDDQVEDENDKRLPPIEKGDQIKLLKLHKDQHFTEPPPRFSEASLVKTLEDYGIGRPSTYASIIYTLQNREYVELENRRFTPTDIGKIVNRFLTEHFTQYVDYDFTAKLEDELDAISRGEKNWVPLMRDFWEPFNQLVVHKEESVTREQVAQSRDLGMHPKMGRPVSVRMGRYGPFVQMGTKDDEEKPKFAGLRPGQKMDSVTLEDAIELFKLPRKLGQTSEGEEVSASVGRFGPYVKYDSKYASIKDDDPYTITLERALEVIAEKKEADRNRIINVFEDAGIQVLNGRYGPYVTDGTKNARIPKDVEPKSLKLEDCKVLLANAPARGRRGAKKKKASTSKKKITAKKKTKTKKKIATKKKKTTVKKKI